MPPVRPLLIAMLAALLGGSAAGQDTSRLGDDVRELFIARCASCHGAELKKPKGRFGFIEDLERVAEEYVVPGEPDDSDLWILTTDPDAPMPPLDSDEPQLTLAELALMRWWIVAGAKPPTAALAATAKAADSTIPAEATVAKGASTALRRAARTHPVVVHFPIALLIVAAFAELLSLRGQRERWRTVVGFCLTLGTLGSIAAAWSGWLLAPIEGYSDGTVFGHRWLGVAAASCAAVATALHFRASPRWLPLFRLFLLATAVLVCAAGHWGGVLVYGEDYFA